MNLGFTALSLIPGAATAKFGVKAGADVAPLIESAKAIKAAAVEAAKEARENEAPTGRVISESVETSYGAFA